jgi:energy-converting hydrogenase Eha subunit G
MTQTLQQISTFLTIAILLGVIIGYLFALARCSEKSDSEAEIINESLHVDELTGIVSDNSRLNKSR